MFTINLKLKIAAIIIGIFGGFTLVFTAGFWYGFPFILIGIGFLVSYILLGTVQSAAQLLEKVKFVEAEERLKWTLNPNWLYVTNRAFYFIMKGSIAANLNRPDEAEGYFEKAKDLKLPSDNERALVYLQLANIKANQGKWPQAKAYFHQIKKFNVSEGMLKDQIKQFEKALNQSGNAVHLRSGQAMQPGGKRRRPKMR
ncbi:MAG: tetratricopeptide repeat protein [Saprospiraceae bacterium]|uniref:Tetratricopeptide repeat protein n=1 Tax=Candidatus Opimibacter skivensis TaxID=2982028 RepID=A0A9D7XQX3_9BACT|nr:tetratricopeptide repeat protein [Candidatus Opimibacter skivensis]